MNLYLVKPKFGPQIRVAANSLVEAVKEGMLHLNPEPSVNDIMGVEAKGEIFIVAVTEEASD